MPPKRKPMTGIRAIVYGEPGVGTVTGATRVEPVADGAFMRALQREMDIAERNICDQIERQIFSPQSWGRTVSPFKHWDADALIAPRYTAVQRWVQARVHRVRRLVAEPRYRVREAWRTLRHGVTESEPW